VSFLAVFMVKLFQSLVIAMLLLSSVHVRADVAVNLSVEYFDIKANDPKDFMRKLRIVKSPIMGDAFAWIHSDTQNDTTYETNEGGCRLYSLDSEIDITITLPRWINVSERAEKHQKWWARLIAFITEHEYKHKDIIVQTAHDFHQAVKSLGIKENCQAVKDAYREVKSKHAGLLRSRDFKLDFSDGGRVAIKDFLFLDHLPDINKEKEQKPANNKNKK
jgi:predicted secreted Zn-dependent protease